MTTPIEYAAQEIQGAFSWAAAAYAHIVGTDRAHYSTATDSRVKWGALTLAFGLFAVWWCARRGTQDRSNH